MLLVSLLANLDQFPLVHASVQVDLVKEPHTGRRKD